MGLTPFPKLRVYRDFFQPLPLRRDPYVINLSCRSCKTQMYFLFEIFDDEVIEEAEFIYMCVY